MMGSLHVRALLSREDIPALVLVEPDAARRAALNQQHGRLRTYGRLVDALEAEALDFAVVAVPIAHAPEAVSTLLERGVAVLAEKPLAGSASDAVALAEIARRHEVLLSVGYIERFNPAVTALRAELARGDCGAVHQIHARRLSPFPYREGMTGVAMDVATHDLDVLRHLTGRMPLRVYAETDTRLGGGGEDLLCATLRYERGETGLVEANWLSPMKVRRLTVTTDSGMYELDYVTQDLWLHEQPNSDAGWEALGVMRGANEGRTIRFALERREPLMVEHERFIDALNSGGEAPVPAEAAADTLRIAEAILESAQRHEPVHVGDRVG
jgi:predicted dehydrogenase